MQELVLKKKSKSKERLALSALQKQMQVIQLKEYLIMAGFIVGSAFLRKAMEPFPSVEPIAFFALLSGWMFGKSKGAVTGVSALYVSNFLMFGGQGPWTIFQAAGFGLIGYLGGFLRKTSKWWSAVLVMIVGTAAYEFIMNFSTFLFLPAAMFGAFVAALPFTLIHLGSNIAFSLGLKPAKKLVEKKAGLDEKKVCKYLMKRIKQKHI